MNIYKELEDLKVYVDGMYDATRYTVIKLKEVRRQLRFLKGIIDREKERANVTRPDTDNKGV